MNRYQKTFTHLRQNKLGAFVPFITLGDPNPNVCMRIIDVLISSGSDALELGIPFSDPVADGYSIQKSIQRAFQSNITIAQCLKLIEKIRNKYPAIPIGLLIYANLIFKTGINKFYERCAKLSIDSILIPDLPIEESIPFYNAATTHNISHIFICPPNATNNLIQKIVSQGNGYIYLLSRSGVTGINKNESKIPILNTIIQAIKQNAQKKLPILQGFGIHSPEQARESILSGINGVISGSAIANIIEKEHSDTELLLKTLQQFIQDIKKSMFLAT